MTTTDLTEAITIIRDPKPGVRRIITVTFLTTEQAKQLPALPPDAPQAIWEIDATE